MNWQLKENWATHSVDITIRVIKYIFKFAAGILYWLIVLFLNLLQLIASIISGVLKAPSTNYPDNHPNHY